MRTVTAIVVLLIACAGVSAQSGRQLPSSGQKTGDEPIKLRAEEVLLNVTVTDDYGHQTTTLRKEDFIVAEDDRRQDIASFAVSEVPVNVVLLLDASGSVAGEVSSLRDAAMHFVDQLSPEDKVSVIEFHTNAELIQDWTANRDDVRHAISWRFRPGVVRDSKGRATPGMTSLYDALYLATNEQLSKVEGRKAIILLTDGVDNTSKVTYEQAVTSAIKSDAVIYVVSKARYFISQIAPARGRVNRVLGGGIAQQADAYIEIFERAEKMLTDLAKRTGGQIYSPLKDEELKDVYGQVARELKNQYIITYVSKNEQRDGRLRHVKVYLARPGYAARTREGYYAPRG